MRATASARVLKLIATGAGLSDVLTSLVREIEAAHPRILGSVLLLDDEGRLRAGAAPSLPDFYNEAIDGAAIGPAVGSCGTAAYFGQRVIVSDIQSDPLWFDFRALAAEAGVESCWSEPILDADGRVLGTFAMYGRQPGGPGPEELTDIAEAADLAAIAIQRARAEEALTASEASAQRARLEAEAHTHRLKVALGAANAAAVEVDYETETVWTSPEFKAVCGREMTYGEARKAIWPFVHPEDGPITQAAVRAWLGGAAPEDLEVRTVLPGGQEKWVRICTEILKDGAGRWRKIISLILDIDQRKRQELALVEAERAAHAAAEAKALFLANMSHEIRTPLNGVLTMAQLMARGELDPLQRDKIDVILQSGRSLLHLINDILDFSKIEAGKLDLECVDFDPEVLLRGAVASFTEAAQEKGLALELDYAPEARGLRRGDPTRLRQLLNNFVSNAVKFTAAGGVFVHVSGEGPGGREGLTLSVRDSGIGIPAEKMPLLFQRFSQVDSSTTRRFGGTGLGLAICGELAQLMGGQVRVESRPGEGSTFSVSLPLAWRHGEAETAEANAICSGPAKDDQPAWRVLAAEDNPTNQVVLRTVMEVFGLHLTIVGNGLEAVEAWRGGGFDLILMDVQMPVMDGQAAARAIRAEERARDLPRTPIIALSANAFRHQIDDYLAAGMDGHVAKPIELANLEQALEDFLVAAGDDAEALQA